MSFFSKNLTSAVIAKKIVDLEEVEIPKLNASLEELKSKSNDLRKNRILGEAIDLKILRETQAQLDEENLELTAMKSTLGDLRNKLNDKKKSEINDQISVLEKQQENLDQETIPLRTRLIKAAAVYKLVLVEIQGEIINDDHFGPSPVFKCPFDDQDEAKMFGDEFEMLRKGIKTKSLKDRKSEVEKEIKKLKNTLEELVKGEIALARNDSKDQN